MNLDKAALCYRKIDAPVFARPRLLQPSTRLHVKALREGKPELLGATHGLFGLAAAASGDLIVYVSEVLGDPVD